MRRDDGFHNYVVHDLLGRRPGITSRAMFGGWGIYSDGVIFAIIVDGELFFKVDEASRRVFEAQGSRQFTYTSRSRPKPVAMPYWLVPEGVMEDADLFDDWIARAIRATRNSGKRETLSGIRQGKSSVSPGFRAALEAVNRRHAKTLKTLARGKGAPRRAS